MSKKTIYIAGLGLIGGSLALGIKRDHPDYEILGYNRSDYSRNIALERGIVDRATSDFKEFAPLADVIILAVPIKQTVAYLKELADLELKDNVIITDAGSTKLDIVEAAERYLTGKNVQFVGSHPMAGSHKSGAIAADVTLFENAYYIFTPTSLTRETTIPELKDILSGLKSRFVEIDAAEHDRVTSQISHFPHLLASGLMEQAADYAQAHEMTNHFAAGGFRDMTRIDFSFPDVDKALYGKHAKNVMKTDVKETDNSYEVDIDLPGFKKDEIEAKLENGYLTISAAKGLDKEEKEEKDGKYIRKERYSGAMSRSFYVGDELKQEDIKAKYEDGILKLSVPKKEQKKVETTKHIAIEG